MTIKQIKGKNILLRKARLEDVESIFNNVWKDEDLLKYTVWRTSPSSEEAKKRIKANIKYQKQNPYIYFVTPIDNENEVIGFGGIIEKKKGYFTEGGLCIAKKYQGRGYGKELLDILLDLAFIKLKAISFEYSFFEGNEISKNLCMHYPFSFFEIREVEEVSNRNLGKLIVYILNKDDYFLNKVNNIK